MLFYRSQFAKNCHLEKSLLKNSNNSKKQPIFYFQSQGIPIFSFLRSCFSKKEKIIIQRIETKIEAEKRRMSKKHDEEVLWVQVMGVANVVAVVADVVQLTYAGT